MPVHFIDVDAEIHIDLTEDVTIDLTLDEDELLQDHLPVVFHPPSQSIVNHNANTTFDKRSNLTSTNYNPPSSISSTYGLVSQKHRRTPGSRSPERNAKKPRIKVNSRASSPVRRNSYTPHVSSKNLGTKHAIELDSDGECIDVKMKRIKRESSTSSEESAYHKIHAGYDLENSEIWKSGKANESKIEFDPLDDFQYLTTSSPNFPTRRYYHPDISNQPKAKQSKMFSNSKLAWRALISSNPTPPRFPPWRALLAIDTRRYTRHSPINSLHLVTSFKRAPGSINRIAQSGRWIAICSASIGGQPDEPDEQPNPYNRDGSLMVWDNDLQSLPGHYRNRSMHVKHYTVNDVKFNPCSHEFISSGSDKCVEVWACEPGTNKYSYTNSWKYDSVPRDLEFKPGESVFAVAERKVYVYSNLSAEAQVTSFSLCGPRKKHNVGSMAWGRERTGALLFASSEPEREDFTGFHKAFDVNEGKTRYEFDEDGAGDAMAITKDGERLALLTRGPNRFHSLRLYDIRGHNPTSVLFTELLPFPSNIEGEINNAAFSADGIYLALGRNDNHTHVYDSRRLDKILFDYEHHGPSRTSPGAESYGVVQVEWVGIHSRYLPMGLVTGGNDGCIRFWDPLKSMEDPTNGSILAESNCDIGCFSLGDHFKGERELVVGDCAGEVSIFDIRHRIFR